MYSTISLDLEKCDIEEMTEAFKGHDVVIEYLPPIASVKLIPANMVPIPPVQQL